MSSIVSSITGQRGGNSGGAGLNYNAESANIINPVTQAQADTQYGNAQDAIKKQQDFLAAIQAQNGLGNQSQVFNQMQGVANGTGPNPAQAQLAQATGANVANQAAMAAGQRGASANVGMMQRQAGQQGAGIQQQAAGQAATLQANQSLNALNQMGSIATNQANQQANATNALNNSVQGEQGQILGAMQGVNNANVGMTSNMNSANAGISGIAAQGQHHLISGLAGGLGAAFMAKGGAVQQYAEGSPDGVTKLDQVAAPKGPKSKIGQYLAQSQANPNQMQQDASNYNSAGKGIGTGIKAGWNNLFGPKPAPSNLPEELQTQSGGPSYTDQNFQMQNSLGAPGESLIPTTASANSLSMPPMASTPPPAASALGGSDILGDLGGMALEADGGFIDTAMKMAPMIAMMAAQGGKVPAMVSPGEKYLSPKDVQKVATEDKNPMQVGKEIPGKPKVGGAKNSYANDTVPATLQTGGIVLPRSVTQAKDAPEKAKAFVAAVMAKKGQSLPRKAK